MNDTDKTTRARARIGGYALNRTNPEVTRLLLGHEFVDFERFANKLRQELSPAGFDLLKTILRMTLKTPIFGPGQDDSYHVEVFTRSELGNELRKGERLNPHDIKLVNQMVKLGVLRQDHKPLPAQRIKSRYGDELMLGAGWEYVYVIPPMAALALLYATNRHRAYVVSLRADPTLERKMPADSESWKRWIGR